MAQGIVLILAGLAVFGWTVFGGLGGKITSAIIGGSDPAPGFGDGAGGGGGGGW